MSEFGDKGSRDLWRSIRRAAAGQCPACAQGRLFRKFLKVVGVTPKFDAPAGPHEWMSRHVFVGVAEKLPGANRIPYFVVL